VQFILEIIGNFAVALLTIAVMAGAVYLLLLMMHWRLGAKSAAREQEALSAILKAALDDQKKISEVKIPSTGKK
jgi:hypothetical protein